MARPSSVPRSSAIERLPRLITWKKPEKPLRRLPTWRWMSPPRRSTLMTEAPWSASNAAVSGPETMADRSRTEKPASGPGTADSPHPHRVDRRPGVLAGENFFADGFDRPRRGVLFLRRNRRELPRQQLHVVAGNQELPAADFL